MVASQLTSPLLTASPYPAFEDSQLILADIEITWENEMTSNENSSHLDIGDFNNSSMEKEDDNTEKDDHEAIEGDPELFNPEASALNEEDLFNHLDEHFDGSLIPENESLSTLDKIKSPIKESGRSQRHKKRKRDPDTVLFEDDESTFVTNSSDRGARLRERNSRVIEPASLTLSEDGDVSVVVVTPNSMFTLPKDNNTTGHRVACHRCGNMRKTVLSCVACPHIYCKACTELLVAELGTAVFTEGCPKCKELCCCGKNKSVTCARVNHCYRKCPASRK